MPRIENNAEKKIKEIKRKIKEKNIKKKPERLEESLKFKLLEESGITTETEEKRDVSVIEFNPPKLESAEVDIEETPRALARMSREEERPERTRYQEIRELEYSPRREKEEISAGAYAIRQDEEKREYAAHGEKSPDSFRESERKEMSREVGTQRRIGHPQENLLERQTFENGMEREYQQERRYTLRRRRQRE